MVQNDKGTEFLNSSFQSMLKRHGIKFYTSENEYPKAAVVERFNRTLKEKMFRYFTHKNTHRYTDVLDELLHSYNNTYHRSIEISPLEGNRDSEDIVRARLYLLKPKHYKWKYKVGDRVRMAKQRRPSRSSMIATLILHLLRDIMVHLKKYLQDCTMHRCFE